jgi:hypothetical protein
VGTVPIIFRGLGNLADDPKTFWEGVKHLFLVILAWLLTFWEGVKNQFLVILEWPLSKFRSFLCFCYDKGGGSSPRFWDCCWLGLSWSVVKRWSPRCKYLPTRSNCISYTLKVAGSFCAAADPQKTSSFVCWRQSKQLRLVHCILIHSSGGNQLTSLIGQDRQLLPATTLKPGSIRHPLFNNYNPGSHDVQSRRCLWLSRLGKRLLVF